MAESMEHEASAESATLSRRDRKRERTRGEIYRAAMNLFLLRGFDAVTIDEICEAADVARATFFLHFPSKDALLIEYGVQANNELAELIRAHRASATATLRAALKMLADRAVRHREVLMLVASEMLTRPPAMVTEQEGQTRTLMSLIAGVIQRGQQAGEFRRRVHPLVAAAALCSAFLAFVYEWIRLGGQMDIEGAIAQTLDMILNGLNERKSRRD